MLNNMTTRELVALHNEVMPNQIKEWKGKKEALVERLSTGHITVKQVAGMIGAKPFNIRERLREAREAGVIAHPKHKRYQLSVVDFARVFHVA